MNLMLLPRVADKVVAFGAKYARSFAIYSTSVFTGLVVLYSALVLSEPRALLEFIYRKPEIAVGAYLLWPLAIPRHRPSRRSTNPVGVGLEVFE